MKLSGNKSFCLHKQLVFILVVGILSFPIITMVSSFHDSTKSFIEFHDEKDTSEQEKLEENSKNDKKDLQIANIDFGNIDDLRTSGNYASHNFKRGFILEILIPPPDFT